MAVLVDHTEADIAALIEADFGKSNCLARPPNQLLDWLHFRARLIARRPRLVSISEAVTSQLSNYPALLRIIGDLRTGADMIPWLSEKIRGRKANHKADPMFNTWQISHFHLGTYYVGPSKIKRTGPLLLAYIDNREAVLLKITRDHGEWLDEEVLKQFLATRPSIMERYELKGIIPEKEKYTEAERFKLRKNGVNTGVEIDGRVFLPGLGVVCSGHSVRISQKTDHFRWILDHLRDAIRNNTSPQPIRSLLAFPIGLPVQLRAKLEFNGDISIYDAVRSISLHVEPAPA